MPIDISRLLSTNHAPSLAEELRVQTLIADLDDDISAIDGETAKLQEQLMQLNQKRTNKISERLILEVVLSPQRRLPPEILGTIFTLILPAYPQNILSICSVCQKWRQVALFTPELWTNLTLRPPSSSYLDNIAPHLLQWVRRSNDLSLTVSIHIQDIIGADKAIKFLSQLPGRHRWREAVLENIPPGSLIPFFGIEEGRMASWDRLESLRVHIANDVPSNLLLPGISSLKTAPRLKRLDIGLPLSVPIYIFSSVPWSQLTDLAIHSHLRILHLRHILQQCENLESCTITFHSDISSTAAVSPLRLSKLRRLYVYHEGAITPAFLTLLEVPVLEDLSIGGGGTIDMPRVVTNLGAVISSFIVASGCHLQRLELSRVWMSNDDFLNLLIFLPSLTNLRLVAGHRSALINDFTLGKFAKPTLIENPLLPDIDALVPNLEVLKIVARPDDFSLLSCSNFMQSRWWPESHSPPDNTHVARLKVVEISYNLPSISNMSGAPVFTRLRDEGLDITVG